MTDDIKKKKWRTHYIMASVLESQNIPLKADSFPSDQFIAMNLPEAIRKTDGADIPAKKALGSAAVAVVAIIVGIVAPVGMALLGAISGTVAFITGVAGVAVAFAGRHETIKNLKELKRNHMKDIVQELITMRLLGRAGELKTNWMDSFRKGHKKTKKVDLEKTINDEPKPSSKPSETKQVGYFLSGLSNVLKVKDAWDKSVTNENKQKAQESIDNTKEKLGKRLDRFKKNKGNNKS